MKHLLIYTFIGIFITILAVPLAMYSAGAGHGDYVLAKLLFPFTIFFTVLSSGIISNPLIIVAFIQYPLYGAIIGFAEGLKKIKIAILLLVVIHMLFASLCFVKSIVYNFN